MLRMPKSFFPLLSHCAPKQFHHSVYDECKEFIQNIASNNYFSTCNHSDAEAFFEEMNNVKEEFEQVLSRTKMSKDMQYSFLLSRRFMQPSENTAVMSIWGT